MNELEQEVISHLDTIDPDRDLPDRMKKLGEEFGELCEAIVRGHGGESKKEAADCIIVLIDLMGMLGSNVVSEVRKKLEELKARV